MIQIKKENPLSNKSNKFVVATKEASQPGTIRQGKFLGKYRKKESADRARPALAARQNLQIWETGIFINGQLQD